MAWEILLDQGQHEWNADLSLYGYSHNEWDSIHEALDAVAQIEKENSLDWRIVNLSSL
jgi:hypothetical protein